MADRVLAAALLVALSPAMGGIALWILLDEGPPVLFVQRRVGKDGREFPMVKFRTMVDDAVRIGLDLGLSPDPYAVVKDDPRITRSGRVLRRTGLDELPQLLNVLVGQMSLVGPRPDVPEQVAGYSEHDRRRLEVLPGITGYSQLVGRDRIAWPDRIAQDIRYVDAWTLGLDLRILLLTPREFLRRDHDPLPDDRSGHRPARPREIREEGSAGV